MDCEIINYNEFLIDNKYVKEWDFSFFYFFPSLTIT